MPADEARPDEGRRRQMVDPLAEELSRTIPARMAAQGVPGLAVGVCDASAVLWSAAFGRTRRHCGRHVDTSTIFSVQSTSKMYTATCVLRAVQAGVLLQEHRSDVVAVPVGRNFEYSNLGIDLAGYALQRAVGVPFGEYARRELFTPLQLDRTTFHMRRIATEPNHAIGHWELSRRANRSLPVRVPMVPAGGPYASVDDALRYVQFHRRAAKDPSRTRCWKSPTASVSPHRANRTATGWAWRADEWDRGIVVYNHGGAGFGFLCSLFWIPSVSLGAVVADQLPRSRPATGGLAGDRQVARAGQYAPDPVTQSPALHRRGRQAPSLQTRGRAPCRGVRRPDRGAAQGARE